MKVLFVISKKTWGGVVSLSVATAEKLKELGHEAYFIVNKESEFSRRAPEHLNVIRKKFGPDYNPALILFTINFIRNRKIDIVITNIQKEITIGGIAAKICNIPSIRQIGSDRDFTNQIKRKINQKLFIDQNIVICETTKKQIINDNPWVNPETLSVIHNGCEIKKISDSDIQSIKENYNINKEDIVFGVTSRLVKFKAVDQIIEAFAIVNKSYKNTKLLIVGDGAEKNNLENIIKKHDLIQNVILTGFLNEVMPCNAIHDISISASLKEGFPHTILEYMSLGNPVIATDVDGVHELVKNDENGFLIPANDKEALINSMQKYLDNIELIKIHGKNAYNTILNNFTSTIMVKKMIKLFEELRNKIRS